MALTWDLTKVADYQTVDPTLREALIMSTINIGIGNWTEDNAPEVYARIHLLESVYGGPTLYHVEDGVRTDRPITPEDVRRLIGLRTNVGPLESRSSFIKRHVTYHLDEDVRHYRRATKASDAA